MTQPLATGLPIDIVVAGAGLSGRAFALAASRGAAGLSVALCGLGSAADPGLPAEFDAFDARIYAITPGNAAFLDALGAWQSIPAARICPVYGMRVHGDEGQSAIEFDAYRAGAPELAWIVEDSQLQGALAAALRAEGRVIALPELVAIEIGDRASGRLNDGTTLEARLLVGADGAESGVRRAAGIDVRAQDYGQAAVVANFDCERPHRNIALQWFQGGPVLALLPLPGQRVSMVWSTAPEHADRLLALDPAALCAEVEIASKSALGALSLIGQPRRFPLRRLHARRVVAPRVALIGDAAHVVHPLAGQGANLGLQDARVLAEVLAERPPSRDPGDLGLLRQYERRRAEPARLMETGVHGLQRLFAAPGRGAALLRNRGLNLVNRLPVIKGLLARQAMH